MENMTNTLKNATVSVLLCSFIILTRMDLSYLSTYLQRSNRKITETRKDNPRTVVRETITLPQEKYLLVRRVVFSAMVLYTDALISGSVDEITPPTIHVGSDCRGSPSRSP